MVLRSGEFGWTFMRIWDMGYGIWDISGFGSGIWAIYEIHALS